jgi:hypothetical protein
MARRYVQGYNPHAVFWSHGARMVIFFSADGNDTAAVHQPGERLPGDGTAEL